MTETNKIARPADKLKKNLTVAALSIFTGLIGILLAASLPQALADKETKPFSLTILHTNDIHAHDQPFQDRGKIVGGMARLGHLVRQLRKENSGHTIVADAGDIFQGTAFFTRYRGEVEVELLNLIGYDVYTIGNHEFDEGGINLADQLARAKFDVLNCNLDATALPSLQKILKPAVIKNIGGQKVAFIGAITPDIETLSLNRDGVNLKRGRPLKPDSRDDLSWLSPIKDEVDKIATQGVDKIVLVTHCGLETDKILAAEIPQIDAIIGGHSHTRLAAAVIVTHDDGSHTVIVQTGNYGRNLGKLNLVFDTHGAVNVAATHYELLPITKEIPEDKDIKEYLERKGEPLKTLKEVVSFASKDFDNNFRGMKTDSALGDLICDSFYEAGKADGAQITFENRGGIRSRIEQGNVTLEKIEELLPFENHLVFADVTGDRLKKTLEHSVAGSTGGKFLDVHGMKFAYDSERKMGDRIIYMLVEKDGQWQEVDPAASYRIGMTDYSFKGGEGYQFADAKNIKFTELKLNEYLKRYLQNHPQIKPQYGDRIAWLNGTLLPALVGNDFSTNAKFDHCSNIKVSIYTSDKLGVSTVFSDRHKNGEQEKSKAAVVPLDNPEEIAGDIAVKHFASTWKENDLNNKIKKYVAIVVRGDNHPPHTTDATPVYTSTKTIQAVSYPILQADFIKALTAP